MYILSLELFKHGLGSYGYCICHSRCWFFSKFKNVLNLNRED